MGLFTQSDKERIEELIAKAKRLELELKHVRGLFPKEIKEIEREDLEIIELIKELYHNGKIQTDIATNILKQAEELHKLLISAKASGKETLEMEYLLHQLESFLEEEKIYLVKRPGAGRALGQHVRLIELKLKRRVIVDKAVLEIKGNQIWYDDKPIPKIRLLNDDVEIIAEHYTRAVVAKTLTSGGELTFSLEDPYVYIVEHGRLENESIENIHKLLGVKGKEANARLGPFLTFAPISKTWLRVKRGQPVHIAIEGNIMIKPLSGRAIQIKFY